MSQLFKSKDNKYTIVAETYSNSHNWGHKAKLFNDTHQLNTYKITYYNRTWECYQYQSVALSVIDDYITYLINNYIDDYKDTHNIKRLSKTIREQLTQQAKQTQLIAELETFYKELK